MFDVQGIVTAILAVLVIGLGIKNNNLSDENEQLKIEIRYNKAIKDANNTREASFNEANTSITRIHNEEVRDINNTPIGSTIHFGMHED